MLYNADSHVSMKTFCSAQENYSIFLLKCRRPDCQFLFYFSEYDGKENIALFVAERRGAWEYIKIDIRAIYCETVKPD